MEIENGDEESEKGGQTVEEVIFSNKMKVGVVDVVVVVMKRGRRERNR